MAHDAPPDPAHRRHPQQRPSPQTTPSTTYLLVEHGLGLTTVPALLPVVATLALGKLGGLSSLVLGHLVEGVLAALLRGAKGVPGLRHDHLRRTGKPPQVRGLARVQNGMSHKRRQHRQEASRRDTCTPNGRDHATDSGREGEGGQHGINHNKAQRMERRHRSDSTTPTSNTWQAPISALRWKRRQWKKRSGHNMGPPPCQPHHPRTTNGRPKNAQNTRPTAVVKPRSRKTVKQRHAQEGSRTMMTARGLLQPRGLFTAHQGRAAHGPLRMRMRLHRRHRRRAHVRRRDRRHAWPPVCPSPVTFR